MTETKHVDIIQERYDGTSELRQRAIAILAGTDEDLRLSLVDKDSSKILIKLLDGEDKQTIARQKNATDEKIAGAVGANLPGLVDQVIQAMGGPLAIRGAPDASRAPRERVDCEVAVGKGELDQGEDATLDYESLSKANNAP